MLMDIDRAHHNCRKTNLFYISNTFLEAFQKFKQVDSDSCIMEHTLEISVFQLFDKLPLNIA